MVSKRKHENAERYEINRSPLAQNPTQRDIAKLLGESLSNLKRLITFKEQFIVRRQIETGKNGKVRQLVYPVSRLRRAHEKLKFILNRIRQPDYLYSPRKNRGQRDNAEAHLEQDQYLTLDLRQFYPSTTEQMVFQWLRDEMGLYGDVAGLITSLITADDKVCLGSPATPVLCTLVHRPMFDQIASLCDAHGLRFSLWVDDLTISGRFVPREVLKQVREIVRGCGLQSHAVRYRHGNRPVFITGIGVVGANLVAPNSLNLRIKSYWEDYHKAQTSDERDCVAQRLLASLGTLRHIAGPTTVRGRRASDEMNSIRQKRAKSQRLKIAQQTTIQEYRAASIDLNTQDIPFDL